MSDLDPTPTFHRRATAALVATGLAFTGTMMIANPAGATPTTASATAVSADPADSGDSDTHPRLELICRRSARLENRGNRILDRINGDESVVGSLEWLTAKAAQAREEGREQLAVVFENRRATRTQAIDVIELRLVEIEHILGICADNGIEP